MFIRLLFTNPRAFATIILIVVFSICLHEFMHAWVALKMGDPTAADRGHLTMNPFRQMGWWSIVMLALIGIAWGQVPVDLRNLPSRGRRIAVALAGVSANLALALCLTVLTFVTMLCRQEFAAAMLFQGAVLNLLMLVINLLPRPGLDGFRVLMEFVRFRPGIDTEKLNAAFFILTMILFFCVDYLMEAAQFVVVHLLELMMRAVQ